MPAAPERLVLVDGSSFLHRAYHALPPLTNARGEPTGAVYGVVNMLRRIGPEYAPRYVAVVFDAPGRTFRDDMFAEYKAHREAMPDDLAAQIEPLHAVVRALGLPLLQVGGVEADDVIGTLTARAEAAGLETLILAGDKDMAQLVGPRVTMIDTMQNRRYDREGVIAKFGVPPERIIEYLALVGDASDNIPGVPKVGPKTAAKWLNAYGSLDEVIAHAAEIPGKVGESLRDSLDRLALSRELAAIRRDVDLPMDLEDLRPSAPDAAALREWFARLEFKGWLRELDATPQPVAAAAAPADARPGAYETVDSEDALARWLDALAAAELIAFDTETTGLDPLEARVVGVSFAVEAGHAAYVPLAHRYPDAPPQLDRDAVLARLKPLLEDPACAKLGHNLKYDAEVLVNHGIRMAGIRHDTMLESYVLASGAGRHDLDSLAAQHLGLTGTSYQSVTEGGRLGFQQVTIPVATEYAAQDADYALRLHGALHPSVQAEAGLRRVYDEIEMPLVPVLAHMERTGILVDATLLRAHSEELAGRLVEIEGRAHALAGEPFNLASPKQLQEILFERLGLPVREKTPTGQPSTAEGVLQELAGEHELPRLLLEHRQLAKLRSTYTERLPEQVHPRTGRVHTSFHQAGTATGRLSSSDPNLQNIPIRTAEGRRIRQAFIAPPGHLLVAADYSQIELRILAHLSGDAALRAAFAAGRDIHRATAAEIFGVGLDAVDGDQRRAAKAINFGLVYGMSAFGLARQLGIERHAAQDYMERYFARYPGVQEFMESVREGARKRGYVETFFGRRLAVPDIASRNGQRRMAAERAAINAPMQGTAADIIKRAMVAVQDWIDRDGVPARLLLQVHDELVLEAAEDAVEAVEAGLRARMAAAAELAVPLEVTVAHGCNWEEAH